VFALADELGLATEKVLDGPDPDLKSGQEFLSRKKIYYGIAG
jgi:hypothetical protein